MHQKVVPIVPRMLAAMGILVWGAMFGQNVGHADCERIEVSFERIFEKDCEGDGGARSPFADESLDYV